MCALSFAFFGLLRIGEYCDSALLVRHVRMDEYGVLLEIPISKGSLRPVHVRLLPRADELCPVTACIRYSSLFASERDPSEAFFLFGGELDGSPATRKRLGEFIKLAAHYFMRKDPALYAGHSLRRGGTTELYLQGVPEAVIQQHGRWKGITMRRYLQYEGQPSLLLGAASHSPLQQQHLQAVADHPLMRFRAIEIPAQQQQQHQRSRSRSRAL